MDRARWTALLLAAGLAGCAHAPAVTATVAASPLPPAELECQVWDRELGFARAVAEHDAAAFAEHLHPEAVFVEGGGVVTRGRAAVLESWRAILAGEPVRLWWHPTSVVAGGGSGLALSRGPYLVEDPRPQAKHPFLVGDFQSLWVRGPDGAWRVFLDGGTPPPRPATPEEAARLRAELQAPCPRAGAKGPSAP